MTLVSCPTAFRCAEDMFIPLREEGLIREIELIVEWLEYAESVTPRFETNLIVVLLLRPNPRAAIPIGTAEVVPRCNVAIQMSASG